MTHSICTSEAGEELAYFQRLWQTLLAPDIDPKTSLKRLFEQETVDFDMEYAFLSAIDLENETERFEIVHGSHEMLRPGATVPLSETYCRQTVASPEGTMAISDALAEGWGGDPAYETFELGSYLGTTVSVDDDLYGTLCFAGTAARDESIRDTEKALVEMYGQWAAYTLRFRDGLSTQETHGDTLEERAVSSDDIDSVMDALRSRPRRVILVTLMRETETSVAALEQMIPHENTRLWLYHNHLPKLVDDGYITWDKDAKTISRGPNFSDLEPLVRLVKEYDAALPE